jgi:hypothetical protein
MCVQYLKLYSKGLRKNDFLRKLGTKEINWVLNMMELLLLLPSVILVLKPRLKSLKAFTGKVIWWVRFALKYSGQGKYEYKGK